MSGENELDVLEHLAMIGEARARRGTVRGANTSPDYTPNDSPDRGDCENCDGAGGPAVEGEQCVACAGTSEGHGPSVYGAAVAYGLAHGRAEAEIDAAGDTLQRFTEAEVSAPDFVAPPEAGDAMAALANADKAWAKLCRVAGRTAPPGATDAEVARLRAELADARRELADVRANYEELCHAAQTHRTASLALEEARILRLGGNAGAVDLRTATHRREDALAKLYALAGVEL